MWWHGASAASLRSAATSIPGVVPAALIVMLVLVACQSCRDLDRDAQRPDQRVVHRALRLGRHVVVFATVGYVADWFRWVFARSWRYR
jgi:hypothetical protein